MANKLLILIFGSINHHFMFDFTFSPKKSFVGLILKETKEMYFYRILGGRDYLKTGKK